MITYATYSQFNMGAEVPRSYYFAAVKPVATDDMETAAIPRRSKKKLSFDVAVPDSVLRYVPCD